MTTGETTRRNLIRTSLAGAAGVAAGIVADAPAASADTTPVWTRNLARGGQPNLETPVVDLRDFNDGGPAITPGADITGNVVQYMNETYTDYQDKGALAPDITFGTVLLYPAGDYYITSPLPGKRGLTHRGAGFEAGAATALHYTGPKSDPAMFLTDHGYGTYPGHGSSSASLGWAVEGMTLDGGQATGDGTSLMGIFADGSNGEFGVRVERVRVTNMPGNGVQFNCLESRLRHCQFSAISGHGIFVAGHDFGIEDVWLSGAMGHGVYITGSEGWLSNVDIEKFFGPGDDTTTACYYIGGGGGIKISACHARGGRYGLWLDGVSRISGLMDFLGNTYGDDSCVLKVTGGITGAQLMLNPVTGSQEGGRCIDIASGASLSQSRIVVTGTWTNRYQDNIPAGSLNESVIDGVGELHRKSSGLTDLNSTVATISHGLPYTPDDVSVEPYGNSTQIPFVVDGSETPTTFRIGLPSAPTGTQRVRWRASYGDKRIDTLTAIRPDQAGSLVFWLVADDATTTASGTSAGTTMIGFAQPDRSHGSYAPSGDGPTVPQEGDLLNSFKTWNVATSRGNSAFDNNSGSFNAAYGHGAFTIGGLCRPASAGENFWVGELGIGPWGRALLVQDDALQLHGSGHDVVLSATATAALAGAWHSFFATYDGTSSALYLDGELVAGPGGWSGYTFNNDYRFRAASSAGYSQYSSGAYAEVVAWGSALSATDVAKVARGWMTKYGVGAVPGL